MHTFIKLTSHTQLTVATWSSLALRALTSLDDVYTISSPGDRA